MRTVVTLLAGAALGALAVRVAARPDPLAVPAALRRTGTGGPSAAGGPEALDRHPVERIVVDVSDAPG